MLGFVFGGFSQFLPDFPPTKPVEVLGEVRVEDFSLLLLKYPFHGGKGEKRGA